MIGFNDNGEQGLTLVSPPLEPNRVRERVDESRRVRQDDVDGHALRAHLLVHDFSAVERLERSVDERERDAKDKDHRDRRVRAVHVRVPRLPVLGRQPGDRREDAREPDAAEVEARAARHAVRHRRARERACAGEDVVREVVEQLGVLVGHACVPEDGRQEVGDELDAPHVSIRVECGESKEYVHRYRQAGR